MKEEQTKLELYKIAVDMADKVSQRRLSTNHFYLTLVAILWLGVFLFYAKEPIIALFIPILTLFLCWIWANNLRSYKQLNSAKFKVINEIEQELPLQIFQKESQYYNQDKRKDFTDIETKVPYLFMLASVLFYACLCAVLLLFALP